MGDKNPQHTFLRMGSKAGGPSRKILRHVKEILKSHGMNRLNSHFLRPSPTRSRDVTGDGQSALVAMLGVSLSRSRLLTGPHPSHPGIVQQAQGRSSETSVSPHYNNQ
jgi:hypothetical protein